MRKALRYGGWAVLIYVSFVAGLYMAQRQILYIGSSVTPDIKSAGIPNLRAAQVKTQDGLDITGWYVPAANKNMPTIVFFHGNASRMSWSMMKMPEFIEKGYGILIGEYRGYSGNPGKPTEEGLYNDGRAYIDWLKLHGINEEKIILYAESIGTGIAVQMAGEYAPFRAIVLEAPFTSAVDVAGKHYWFVPVRRLFKDRYDSYGKIEQIKSPLIVVHGKKDMIIPYEFGLKLFDKAPHPKTMITLDDAGHNDIYEHGAVEKILSALTE